MKAIIQNKITSLEHFAKLILSGSVDGCYEKYDEVLLFLRKSYKSDRYQFSENDIKKIQKIVKEIEDRRVPKIATHTQSTDSVGKKLTPQEKIAISRGWLPNGISGTRAGTKKMRGGIFGDLRARSRGF